MKRSDIAGEIAQVTEIDLSQIKPGDNDRTQFDADALAELAASIKADGLLQPITLRPVRGKPPYEIVAGERRFRAIQLLGWSKVPAMVRFLSDEQAASLMLAENVQRADLDPLDEAHAYAKRMEQFRWSISECAKRSKKSAQHVTARLSLLDLLPEVQALLRKQQIALAFGEVMAPLDSNRQRIALQYLTGADKPLLREFRAIVGQLLAEQAQEPLFDAALSTQFIQEAVDSHNRERAELLKRRFPVDPNLPQMERDGTIGGTFETYIKLLQASDDPYLQNAAPVVGRIYDSLLRGGMAFPPGTSSKRKG